MITQEQAENMVYTQLLEDYTEQEIKDATYKVRISNNEVIVIGDGWCDRYKVISMPALELIGH